MRNSNKGKGNGVSFAIGTSLVDATFTDLFYSDVDLVRYYRLIYALFQLVSLLAFVVISVNASRHNVNFLMGSPKERVNETVYFNCCSTVNKLL